MLVPILGSAALLKACPILGDHETYITELTYLFSANGLPTLNLSSFHQHTPTSATRALVNPAPHQLNPDHITGHKHGTHHSVQPDEIADDVKERGCNMASPQLSQHPLTLSNSLLIAESDVPASVAPGMVAKKRKISPASPNNLGVQSNVFTQINHTMIAETSTNGHLDTNILEATEEETSEDNPEDSSTPVTSPDYSMSTPHLQTHSSMSTLQVQEPPGDQTIETLILKIHQVDLYSDTQGKREHMGTGNILITQKGSTHTIKMETENDTFNKEITAATVIRSSNKPHTAVLREHAEHPVKWYIKFKDDKAKLRFILETTKTILQILCV